MSRLLKLSAIVVLTLIVIARPNTASMQDTAQWSYLLIQPADSESKLLPYVIQLTRTDENVGFIFSQNVIATLFVEAMAPMELQVFPVIPHIQSGGYRLETTEIWSGTTVVQDVFNTQLLNTPAFAAIHDDIGVEGLYGSRPAAIQGQTEALVIGRNLYTPSSTAQPYESCGPDEDVKGVLMMDFAQNDPRFPTFQILQLGIQEVRFALPSFEDTRGFLAIGNNIGSEERGLEIVQIDTTGDDLGTIRLRPRESFDQLNALYESMDRSGAKIFPAFARVDEYDPLDGSLEIQMQRTPDCRSLARGVEVSPLEGIDAKYGGLRFYLPSATDGLGVLQEDEVIEIESLSSQDGRICFDQPGGAQGLVCSAGWLMRRVTP